ncbi:hypothetical protein RIR_jg11377.t1 [Rhizophagus irregularis DAOM 181602=DAOM 197198]|nr:hypothetical protein RIR_jg11377.t1 [Rhizophagus irregularis DAOM 181602=DAOM 197198]
MSTSSYTGVSATTITNNLPTRVKIRESHKYVAYTLSEKFLLGCATLLFHFFSFTRTTINKTIFKYRYFC